MKLLTQKRVLAALVALLFISALLPDRFAAAVSATPSHVLTSVLNPFTRPVTRFSNWLRGPSDLRVGLGDREHNLEAELLKADGLNLQLHHDLDQANMTINRMNELRRTLPTTTITIASAAVTQVYTDPGAILMTINIGSPEGVGRGMVVANGPYLVGRIAGVGPMTATVRLITTPSKVPLGVRIAPASAGATPGAALTLARPASNGREFWADAEVTFPVQLGDLARLDDDYWPEARGLVVGKVIRIEPLSSNPLFQHRLVIQPIQDLMHLNHVEVLIPTRGESR